MPGSNLEFSTRLGQVMINHLENCLSTRACWIFVEFLENEKIRGIVLKDLKKNSKKIQQLISSSKEGQGNKGLAIVASKIAEL